MLSGQLLSGRKSVIPHLFLDPRCCLSPLPSMWIHPKCLGTPPAMSPFSLQLVAGAPQVQRCPQDLLEAYRRGLSCTVSVMWVVEQEHLGIGPPSKAKDMGGRQIFVTWLLWSPFTLPQRTVLPRAQSI
ncbi:unnamed protein product [Rangifer tarandus platyrhynchus]|uniref:Uncharacterized protein n=2 Tax=Rangifer tarandus platyrhynchus TaxID=3082113 RepID=A0AC59YJL2_RANTA|nr:unnamed protein product [Rangifer tarandus platyrhynchus]